MLLTSNLILWFSEPRDVHWLGLAVGFFLLLNLPFHWFVRPRIAYFRTSRGKGVPIAYTFYPDRFVTVVCEAHNTQTSTTYYYHQLRKVWEFQDSFVLILSNYRAIPLPKVSMSPEESAQLAHWLYSGGARAYVRK